MKNRILALLGGAATLVLGCVLVDYILEMRTAYARVSGKSTVLPSPHGDVEYTENGVGPDVLVIHGSGGGYDQGELLAQTLLGGRFHAITPSRFGYLKSTFREGANFDDQADAYAYLLDHLSVKRVAVVALSHGGPSALTFALLYPERVSSLTLLSSGVAPVTSGEQSEADVKGKMLVTIFKHDWLYWAVSEVFRSQLMELLGVNTDIVGQLSPEQLRLAVRMIDYMNPVSQRSAGTVFDNSREKPGNRIAGIRAPTLIVHAEDDTLQLYANAEFAAAHIADARMMSFKKGGHFVIGIELATVRPAVQEHILENWNK